MDFAQVKNQFIEQLNQVNQRINNFFNFVIGKLKNYKNLSLGEQIAYPVIGVGFLLILISIILFIV
jgi:ABC-type transport system involved in cytochrome c biogenesis permease subunit